MSEAAYDLVRGIADKLKPQGYLRAYENDLTKHDREMIVGAQGGQFIWAVRDTGTWCLTRQEFCGDHTDQWTRSCYRCEGVLFDDKDHYRVFFWDGTILRPIDRADFVAILRSWDRH